MADKSPLLKYVLTQIPGWLGAALFLWLGVTVGLPVWLAASFWAAWVVKDLVLFPAMRAVFRPPAATRPIGARAQTVDRLAPSGYVRVNGELWPARTHGAVIEPGHPVIVTSASGLTLIVEEADPQ